MVWGSGGGAGMWSRKRDISLPRHDMIRDTVTEGRHHQSKRVQKIERLDMAALIWQLRHWSSWTPGLHFRSTH